MSDREGRLWLASSRSGLLRVDNPEAERPTFKSYTTTEGLSSNNANVITEDLSGNIYVATGRGLDRLDPETNHVKHFTTADGLAPGKIQGAFRDSQGALWFGTRKGLSRYLPGKDAAAQPPPVFITNLRVAGARQSVSSLGEAEVLLPDLAADQNQLQIDFVGLGFAPGEVLRYQYRLEGADADWSAPIEQRTVNFARLAPGRYRFLVRAVNSDGTASLAPAMITFTILRPIWQRWWFLSLVILAVGLGFYSLYRYRVSRLLELGRVRTRIATDLHDDIGAGLSRIAVLSEVARHEAGSPSPVTERLSVIAGASRELVDSMSDIVWLINPARDQLRDLMQRMRRFASDVFTGRGIEFTFSAPADERHLKVGADVRRHVYLIFKEAVNNVVRHSGCTEAHIELRAEDRWFVLMVRDDGRGFNPAQAGDGDGLANMRERARMMGAQLQVDSGDGRGTTVTLRVMLRATVKERNTRLRGSRR
jgi:signal transduction histidine kinase